MLVIDIPGRAVRAIVGSAGRERPGGWIDLTDQPRSPGSTLKPFIYAMAFDDAIAMPTTMIGDLPKRFDAYQPENFDRSFRGDVTIAEALQHSLNVPAVLALAQVGPERFVAQLALAGAAPRVHGGAPERSRAGGGSGRCGADRARARPALCGAWRWWPGPATGLAGGDGGGEPQLRWPRLLGGESAAKVLEILRNAPARRGACQPD